MVEPLSGSNPFVRSKALVSELKTEWISTFGGHADIIFDIDWNIELESEVERWLEQLAPATFAIASFHLDRLSVQGAALRMPQSPALGDGLFELRFDIERAAWRLTYWFASGNRIVLLTVFPRQRMNERVEVERARRAMARCIAEQHSAEEND